MENDASQGRVKGAHMRCVPGHLPRRSAEDRFWDRVCPEPNTGCWLWLGGLSSEGYGRLNSDHRKTSQTYAHRFSYELARGPIPLGLDLDHLCRNRMCVNPAHLEVVPHRVNVLRGDSPPAKQARQTECAMGHEFTPGNTYVRLDRHGRMCRACQTMREQRRRKAAD